MMFIRTRCVKAIVVIVSCFTLCQVIIPVHPSTAAKGVLSVQVKPKVRTGVQKKPLLKSKPKTLCPRTATNIKLCMTKGNQFGDGRDLEISFTRAVNEANILRYEMFIVKANSKKLNSSDASRLVALHKNVSTSIKKPTNRTTTVKVKLSSSNRDVEGKPLRHNIPYVVYVMSVAAKGGPSLNKLSVPSASLSIPAKQEQCEPVSDVVVNKIHQNQFGDARDWEVCFTSPTSDTVTTKYAVFVVKASDKNFDHAKAKEILDLRPQYTNVVHRSSNTLSYIKVMLNEATYDTDGHQLQPNTPYIVYVMCIGSNGAVAKNQLTPSLTSFTIAKPKREIVAPVITRLIDQIDKANVRNIYVSFHSSSNDDLGTGSYRMFMVDSSEDVSRFDIHEASKVTSGNYYNVQKTSSHHYDVTLPNDMKDVRGDALRSGHTYRLFVMAVGDSPDTYALSTSSLITLKQNKVAKVKQVRVEQVNNFGDGRDLKICFDRSDDESHIDHYRLFVVKSEQADRFNSSLASWINNRDSYTYITKGEDSSLVLSSYAHDTDGEKIRSGVQYQVFILSVSKEQRDTLNELSEPSNNIVLHENATSAYTDRVRISRVESISSRSNGPQLRVWFDAPSTEYNIDYYKVLVVKDGHSMNVSKASRLDSSRCYTVSKQEGRSSLCVTLGTFVNDTDGDELRRNESYRLYVLSVAKGRKEAFNTLARAPESVETN